MPHIGKPKQRRNRKRDLKRDRYKHERAKTKIKPGKKK